jgi:hypothetical protein
MTNTWTLKVIEPNREAREFEAKDGLVFGSHIDCGVVFMDKKVDGHHAKLVLEGDELAILNLVEEDGPVIDGGEALGQGKREILRAGMEIGLGTSTVIVQAPA